MSVWGNINIPKAVNNNFKEKRICLFFNKPGGCKEGDNCKFVHEENKMNIKKKQKKICPFF